MSVTEKERGERCTEISHDFALLFLGPDPAAVAIGPWCSGGRPRQSCGMLSSEIHLP